jgi:hypothetical protein
LCVPCIKSISPIVLQLSGKERESVVIQQVS